MSKISDKKIGIFTLISQPLNVGEILSVLSVIDKFDILVLCLKTPSKLIPISQLQKMWSFILKAYTDKILITAWGESFTEILALPDEFKKATVLTISKKVYAHLNSIGIVCELVPHMKGYHSTFLRKAYREGIALDYILSRYGDMKK